MLDGSSYDVVASVTVRFRNADERNVSDSVAPLVKTISAESRAPIALAITSRDRSTACWAVFPYRWSTLAALPKVWLKKGSIASKTRGSTGVVAW